MFLLLTVECALWGDALPEWLLPLRNAVFEQVLDSNQIKLLYNDATAAAEIDLSDINLDLALSRCELLMGQALLNEEKNAIARPYFVNGLRLAEKALGVRKSAEAWVLAAENLSRLCQIGPLSYTIANGLNVEKWANNALTLDPRNAQAQYLVAARWVFAPGLLGNPKKGIEMMTAIFNNSDMDIADHFNVNSAIGYGYIQWKKAAEAKPWLLKAQSIYPANKFVAGLLAKT
jgi:hypothetical protein